MRVCIHGPRPYYRSKEAQEGVIFQEEGLYVHGLNPIQEGPRRGNTSRGGCVFFMDANRLNKAQEGVITKEEDLHW